VSDADRARWDARHAAAGEPAPAPPGVLMGAPELTAAFPTAGRAIDVACGRGGVAVWLALRGLVVDAVDVSPVGLAAGARLAAARGVAQRVRWVVHDLDGGLPSGCDRSGHDASTPHSVPGGRPLPDQGGPYDVVVCQLFRDPARYADLVALLAPGGLLAVTVLSQVGRGTDGPGPFRAPPGELRSAVAARHGLHVLTHREGDGVASLLARVRPVGAPPGTRPAPPPPS
jgi:SAM-dependent methyltransferase